LGPDDRLEPLEGVVVEKTSKDPARRAESRIRLSGGRSKRSRVEEADVRRGSHSWILNLVHRN
jgi:hypothetical protein